MPVGCDLLSIMISLPNGNINVAVPQYAYVQRVDVRPEGIVVSFSGSKQDQLIPWGEVINLVLKG